MVRLVVLLVLNISLSCPAAELLGPAEYGAPPAGKVKILRDTYGVPHIVAQEDKSLFFGVGYALAEDQLERVALNYRMAQGRGAEVMGADQLRVDHLVRMLGVPARAKQGYADLSPKSRVQVDSFVAGLNHFLAQQPASERPEWIQPFVPEDCVAFALFINAMFAVEHCTDDLRSAGVSIAQNLTYPVEGPWGSNQFAISPKRSASGSCLLSIDPHLPHSSFFLWYEMHVVAPGINAMGAALIGTPFVGMGRTQDTAWSMTVNSPDLGDVFVVKLSDEHPGQYEGPNGWTPLEVGQESYLIKTDDGLVTKKMPLMTTEFGPIIGAKDGLAFAIKLSIPDGAVSVQQAHDMMTARDLPQFKKALALQGLLMFNIVYADRHGDIFYISNGRVGRRSEKIDSHQLRPGNERWAQWDGVHALDELPQLANPTNGYLMNTNSGPQNVASSGAPQPADFPSYMMGHSANSRSRRLSHLLSSDESVTWDELQAYATDTRIEADELRTRLIQTLTPTAKQNANDTSRLNAIVEVLKNWDLRTDLESRGAVLFYHLVRNDALVKAESDGKPMAAQTAALAVAADVLERFETLDVRWGDFSRIRHGQHEQGIAGWPGAGGIGSSLRPLGGVTRDGRHFCLGGSSYGMLVDFSGESKSVSCLPFGISEDPESPHYADMMPLYAKRQFKPTWFLPKELSSNVLSEQVLEVVAP